RVDVDRVQHWVGLGAGMSDRVSRLIKESAVA
ncbi:MAG: ribosomal protein S16, partial [Porticoccus sp.]